jgi:hypothetical protein
VERARDFEHAREECGLSQRKFQRLEREGESRKFGLCVGRGEVIAGEAGRVGGIEGRNVPRKADARHRPARTKVARGEAFTRTREAGGRYGGRFDLESEDGGRYD